MSRVSSIVCLSVGLTDSLVVATVVRGMFDPRRSIVSTLANKSNISGRDSACIALTLLVEGR